MKKLVKYNNFVSTCGILYSMTVTHQILLHLEYTIGNIL